YAAGNIETPEPMVRQGTVRPDRRYPRRRVPDIADSLSNVKDDVLTSVAYVPVEPDQGEQLPRPPCAISSGGETHRWPRRTGPEVAGGQPRSEDARNGGSSLDNDATGWQHRTVQPRRLTGRCT